VAERRSPAADCPPLSLSRRGRITVGPPACALYPQPDLCPDQRDRYSTSAPSRGELQARMTLRTLACPPARASDVSRCAPPPVVGGRKVAPAEPAVESCRGVVAPDPGGTLPNVRARSRSRGGATMDLSPSGAQLRVTWGDQRATVVEVGGGIRCCEVGDRPVLDPYPVDAICDGAHAAPRIPWPNRTSRLPSSLQWRPWEVTAQRRRVWMGALFTGRKQPVISEGAGAGREAPWLRDAPG
jgi:hypothetical protein